MERMGTAARGTMGTRQGTAGRGGPSGIPAVIPVVGITGTGDMMRATTGIPSRGAEGQMGRVNYDRNYYVSKMREKLTNLLAQTENNKKKIDTTQKDQLVFQKQTARCEQLSAEVHNLQGELADINLAFDKIRLNARPEDIALTHQSVRAQNDKRRAQLDFIYMQRKKIEDEIQATTDQLQQIHQMMQLRLNELDPSQRNQYSSLVEQNKELQRQIDRKRSMMEQLNMRLGEAEARLKMDSQKLKGKLLKEQIQELQTKKNDLQIQLNQSNLSEPQARQKILGKIKEENQNITNIDKRIKEMKNTIASYEKRLRQLESDLAGKKTDEDDKKKYEVLYQKQKQMDEFLNEFEQLRQNEIQELAKIETKIHAILEENSKILELTNQHTRQDSFNQAKTRANQTIEDLKIEYEVRYQNMKGLQAAEQRVGKEIGDIQEKMKGMSEDIRNKFDNVESVKKQLENEKNGLKKQVQQLQASKDKVQQQLKQSSYDYEIKEKKLKNHEAYAGYSKNERQLKQLQAQKYYLKHNINTKLKDMKYTDLKSECLNLVGELNASLSK